MLLIAADISFPSFWGAHARTRTPPHRKLYTQTRLCFSPLRSSTTPQAHKHTRGRAVGKEGPTPALHRKGHRLLGVTDKQTEKSLRPRNL